MDAAAATYYCPGRAPARLVVRDVRWQWTWCREDSLDPPASLSSSSLPVLRGATATLDAYASDGSTGPLFVSKEVDVCPESAFHCVVPGAELPVSHAWWDRRASCWDLSFGGSPAPREIVQRRVKHARAHLAAALPPLSTSGDSGSSTNGSLLRWGAASGEGGEGSTSVLVAHGCRRSSSSSPPPPSVTSVLLSLLPTKCRSFFEARGRVWDRSPRDIEPHVYTRALRPFLPQRRPGGGGEQVRARLAEHMFTAYVLPAGKALASSGGHGLAALFVASRRCSLASSWWPARAVEDVLPSEELLRLPPPRLSHAVVAERSYRSPAVSDARAFSEELLAFVDACAEEGLLDLWKAFRRRRLPPPPLCVAASGHPRTGFVDNALEPCRLWAFVYTDDDKQTRKI